MAIRRSAVERAADEVRKQRARLQQLADDKRAAEESLAALRSQAPVEYLDDETGEAAGKLARRMAELRDRIDLAARAIPVQQQRVTAAESAYLEAEADELEQPLAAARAALARHEAKTNALLRELEEHECRYVPEAEYLLEVARVGRGDVAGLSGVGPVVTVDSPKSTALRIAVEKAERAVAIVRALAAGEDPRVQLSPGETLADAYPPCVWRADAVVQAPAYARSLTQAEQAIERIDRQEAELQERIAKAEARNATVGAGAPLIGTGDLRNRLGQLPAQREKAVQQLRALTRAEAS